MLFFLNNLNNFQYFSQAAAGPRDGVWQPEPVEDSKITMGNELNVMTTKFAEHFHDSWATRKVRNAINLYQAHIPSSARERLDTR